MPPLPPDKDILDALRLAVLPAAGGAALVMSLFLLPGRRLAAVGSAAAAAFGFVCANHAFTAFGWDKPGRLLPWWPAEGAAGWHWRVPAAVVLLAVGLLTRWGGLGAARVLPERRRWVASVLVWVPRAAAAVVVADWLTKGKAAEDSPGLWPLTASAMLLAWVTLDGLARSGAGAQVAAYQSAIFLAAGIVLLHAHSARSMEVAVVVGSAMFGVAVAAGAARAGDTSGAVPLGVAFLPALLVAERPAYHNVPAASFWLVALAPLVLAPFLIPAVARRDGWKLRTLRSALVLAPLAAAVVLAARQETIAGQDEW